mgnify:CR=1 FL=1
MCGWIPERKEGRKKIELCIIQLTLAIKDKDESEQRKLYLLQNTEKKNEKKRYAHCVQIKKPAKPQPSHFLCKNARMHDIARYSSKEEHQESRLCYNLTSQ